MGFGLGLGRGFRDGFGLGMAQILSLESSHQYAESARPILDHLRRAALERQLIAVKSQMPSLDRIYLARQIGCGNSIGGRRHAKGLAVLSHHFSYLSCWVLLRY